MSGTSDVPAGLRALFGEAHDPTSVSHWLWCQDPGHTCTWCGREPRPCPAFTAVGSGVLEHDVCRRCGWTQTGHARHAFVWAPVPGVPVVPIADAAHPQVPRTAGALLAAADPPPAPWSTLELTIALRHLRETVRRHGSRLDEATLIVLEHRAGAPRVQG